MKRVLIGLTALGFVAFGLPARALPPVKLDPVVSGFSPNPMYATSAGDERLFIAQRNGRIWIWTLSTGLLGTPFLDLSGIVDTTLDGGFYTMAFHPDYAVNGFFFVAYTRDLGPPPFHAIIARYKVSTNPNIADATSEKVLFSVPMVSGSHNNGQIAFNYGDGMLFIGLGDGGPVASEQDPLCRAQKGSELQGKILRVDVDQNVNVVPYYGIPSDNPFTSPVDGIRDEIWAIGFRNPWRFSFAPGTNDLFIADVGHETREEVSRELFTSSGGLNYGWKVMEGTTCFDPDPLDVDCPGTTASCFSPSYTAPIYDYPRVACGVGDCSVIGGYVYGGSKIPGLQGKYIFGDWGSGRIWALEQTGPSTWTRTELLDGANTSLVSFGQDTHGELYVISGSNVLKLAYDGPAVPALGLLGRALLGAGLLAAGAYVALPRLRNARASSDSRRRVAKS
jgi:glucose/arabinose dehydrogenase